MSDDVRERCPHHTKDNPADCKFLHPGVTITCVGENYCIRYQSLLALKNIEDAVKMIADGGK